MFISVVAVSISAIYHLSRPNVQRDDDALKYRYIKMKGDASAEQIATLEDIFELNRDNQKIEQMRDDVETTKRQSASKPPLPSKHDLKSRLQRNKRPKPSPSRTSRTIVRLI